MSTLAYVGRAPDTDGCIVPKNYADTTNTNTIVNAAYIDGVVATALGTTPLATQAYINSAFSGRLSSTTVQSQLNSYALTSLKGASGGIASLTSSGYVTSTQVPSTIPTDRVAFSVAATSSTIYLSSTATQQVVTNTVTEFKLASVVIPDPGWPWRALPFAMVQGYASGSAPTGGRDTGGGTYGLLTCCPPPAVSSVIYGQGICTDAYGYPDYYQMFPGAAANATPLTVAPISGSLELDLYACNSSLGGLDYTFSGAGLVYWVLVVPAM